MSIATITVTNGKLQINDVVFDHEDLRKAKEYLQLNQITECKYLVDSEDQVHELDQLMQYMAYLSPEAIDDDLQSFALN